MSMVVLELEIVSAPSPVFLIETAELTVEEITSVAEELTTSMLPPERARVIEPEPVLPPMVTAPVTLVPKTIASPVAPPAAIAAVLPLLVPPCTVKVLLLTPERLMVESVLLLMIKSP